MDKVTFQLPILLLAVVDMYMVHSPMRVDARLESWRAMESILATGRAHSLGVCNYGIHHLEELLAHCTVRPAVNQVRCSFIITSAARICLHLSLPHSGPWT